MSGQDLVSENKTILDTGTDDDILTVTADAVTPSAWNETTQQWEVQLASQALAIGIDAYDLRLGEGDDSLQVNAWASAADPTAIGIRNSDVDSGAGNDSINIWANTNSSVRWDPAIGAQNSSFSTGAGSDNININASANGDSGALEAYGLLGTTADTDQRLIFDTGSDNDSLNISANASGNQWRQTWNETTQQWEVQLASQALAIGIDAYDLRLGEGDDSLQVNAWASAADPTAIGIRNSDVDSGAGNDSINIWANTNSSVRWDPAIGAQNSSFSTGAGSDNININASANGDSGALEAYGLLGTTADTDQRLIFDTGSDNDSLNISANASGNQWRQTWNETTQQWEVQLASQALAIGIDAYDLRLGEGDDSLQVNAWASAADPTAIGIRNSDVDSGAGNDSINIWANTNSSVRWDPAIGAQNSSFSTGAGSDNININASANGDSGALEAYGLLGTTADTDQRLIFDTGSDNDSLNISANASGNQWRQTWNETTQQWEVQLASQALAIGIDAYDLRLGEGDDSLQVNAWASAADPTAIGIRNSDVDSGAGNDSINIWANTNSSVRWDPAIGAQNSSFSTGAGSDNININASANGDSGALEAYGLLGTTADTDQRLIFDTGSDNDSLNISANASGNQWRQTWNETTQQWEVQLASQALAIGIDAYDLRLGEGDDSLQVNAWASAADPTAIGIRNSDVDSGAGNDSINIWANTNSSVRWDPAIGAQNSSFSTGAGSDNININASANGDSGALEAYGLLGTTADTDQRLIFDTGSDNDSLNISANASGNQWRQTWNETTQQWEVQLASQALAIGIDAYDLRLGEGDDSLQVNAWASAADPTAIGIRNSDVDSGAGNDSINIWANTNSSVRWDPAIGAQNSSFSTGAGSDNININASANGDSGALEAYGLLGTTADTDQRLIFDTGSDNDSLNISANASGNQWRQTWNETTQQWEVQLASQALAIGIDAYDLRLGEGDDSLQVNAWASAADPTAIGIRNSDVDSGAGNDSINIWANTNSSVRWDPAIGAQNSSFSTGAGSDNININASANGDSGALEAYGLLGTTADTDQRLIFDTGSDNDSLNISANASGNQWRQTWNETTQQWEVQLASQALAIGIDAYDLRLGEGDDSLQVNAWASAADPTAIGIRNSDVDSGAGNDSINIWANTNSSVRWDPAIGAQNSSFSTGAGSDNININASANGDSGALEAYGLLGTTADTDQRLIFDTGSDNDSLNISANASGNQWRQTWNETTQQWEVQLASQALAIGIDAYDLRLGEGDDSLQVNAWASAADPTAIGIRNSDVDSGAGNDSINIWANLTINEEANPKGIALIDTTIRLGAGDDNILIVGGILNSAIEGGSGYDLIRLEGVSRGSASIKGNTHRRYTLNYLFNESSYSFDFADIESIQLDDWTFGKEDISPIAELDEANYGLSRGLLQFNSKNETSLLINIDTGELLIAPNGQDSPQILLTNQNASSFLPASSQTAIAAEAITGGTQLLSWQDAGTITRLVTEQVTQVVGSGRRAQTISSTITKEVAENVDAGFVINSFDANGVASSPAIRLGKADQATYDAEYLFGFDLNGDGIQGRNVQSLDESSFHSSNNLVSFYAANNTGLLRDINSGELLIAPNGQDSPQILLTNQNASSFLPASSQTAIAAEAITGGTQLLSWQDAGTITRLVTEQVTQVVGSGRRAQTISSTITKEVAENVDAGFVINSFDANGVASSPAIRLGKADQATYDAEYLFGFDLNGDGIQGRNVQSLDESSFHSSNNLVSFYAANNTGLLRDINSGELLIAPNGQDSPQILLTNQNASSFLPASSQTAIAAEAITGGTQLLSWQDAGTITRLVTEQVTQVVGSGRRAQTISSTITKEVTENVDAGFVINSFDANGVASSPAIRLGKADQATYDAEYLFGFDLNGDGIQGRNVQSLDESSFHSSNNLVSFYAANNTGLLRDINSGELLIAPNGQDSPQILLTNQNASSFLPASSQTAIAAEAITGGTQLLSWQDAGTITRLVTEQVTQVVGSGRRAQTISSTITKEVTENVDAGFVINSFDANGVASSPAIRLGKADQATYDAEYLFGFDLNGDGIQGRNVQSLDESSFHSSNNLVSFYAANNTGLLRDINSGELLIAPNGQDSPQILLTNQNASSFLPASSQTAIAAEAITGGTQLLSWQDAGTITRLVTEQVTQVVGSGRRAQTISSTITKEVTENVDAGFVINSFDANGVASSPAIRLGKADQATYDAEYLFGFDLNGDGIQGSPSQFQIDISYSGLDQYASYFREAANLWESVIGGDLVNIGTIDDIYIQAFTFNDDSNLLGWAAPSSVRVVSSNTVGLTATGIMAFNENYLDDMLADGSLTGVIAHEIGHILGFGTLWQDWNTSDQYVNGPWNQYGQGDLINDSFGFTGSNALLAYDSLTGIVHESIPIEDGSSTSGTGSIGSHWRETTFGDELMTPIAGGSLEMSSVTIASMADLGYQITDQVLAPSTVHLQSNLATAQEYLLQSAEQGPVIAHTIDPNIYSEHLSTIGVIGAEAITASGSTVISYTQTDQTQPIL